MRTPHYAVLLALAITSTASAQLDEIVPKPFEPPARTNWTPEGCRIVPASDDVLASGIAWRNLHSDEANTDEVSIALAPVFREGWTAESETWNPTGPVFDSQGNLYFSPLLPFEDVLLISLDPEDGSRRFTIPNTNDSLIGGSSPMIINVSTEGPNQTSGEMVVLALYDRMLALNTDGTVVWDAPTGLTSEEIGFSLGANYAPAVDAVVGLSNDGFLYALDRRTGEPVHTAPYALPGENSPGGSGGGLPGEVLACILGDLGRFVDLSRAPFSLINDTLRGTNVKVANQFSIDAHTSTLWVAATAPDDEDGALDGVSELGALYKLEFVPNGDKYDIVEACHASFEGGSASTPAVRKDGTRIYLSDAPGTLIAIEAADCSRAWELDVGFRIGSSLGVASDNNEIYAATRPGIVQVLDEGDKGVVNWRADMDAYELPPGLVAINGNLVSIGANAVYIQIEAGFEPDFPVTEGIAQLDRETGALRYFTHGGEGTVAVMSTGPDGAIYMGNSANRSTLTRCRADAGDFPFGGPQQTGGITKYVPERLDLLARDAACAAADRASNAFEHLNECRDSAEADVTQVGELIGQANNVAQQANADGDLPMEDLDAARAWLVIPDVMLKIFDADGLGIAESFLRGGCGALDD